MAMNFSNTTNDNHKSTHENMTVAICLSLLGGFLDAYSYLLKGNVFANAQTGNAVLLFISLANHELRKCIKYIIPIITFAFGILLSNLFKSSNRVSNFQRLKIILIVEATLLLCISCFGEYFSNYMVNCAISLIAAIQVANFDKIDNHPIATTMITGNLKSSMIHLAKYLSTRDKDCFFSFLKYALVIISFGIGVITGTIATKLLTDRSLLLCEVMIIIPYILIRKDQRMAVTSN